MTARAITGMNFKLVLTASGLALAIAAPADARKREPAPIIYAGQGAQTVPAGQRAANPVSVPRAATPTATSGARIEFRYPDQPDVYYNENGARQDAGAAPISFSSSESAIRAEDARQYASARAPVYSTAPDARDPAITAGGFDARAAANRVAAAQNAASRIEPPQASDANIQEASMRPIEAKPSAPAPSARSAAAQPQALTSAPYQPVAQPGYDETGIASIYDRAFDGQPTANGEILDMAGMTAAHPTLPLPSLVQIINEDNGLEVVVRINDRGPFEDEGLIQVSGQAATVLGFRPDRAPRVRVRYLGPAPVLAGAGEAAPSASLTQAAYAPPPANINTPVVEIAALPPRLPVPDPVGSVNDAASGSYFVQAGSFSDISNAQKLHATLSGSFDVDIVPARVRGADYFRVMVGPLSGKEAATNLRDRLEYQGVANGLVVER